MPTYDACFVGLTILDISGRPVTKIPDGGGVDFIDEIRLCPAGTAAGALMNAAKVGTKCNTIACVGDDEKGDFIINFYNRLGNIDTSNIAKTSEMPTSATILPIRPNGDRPALHQRGASDKLFISDEDFEGICDVKVLHHGGTGLLRDMDDSGQSAKLLAYAKSKGVITTLDLIAPNEATIGLLKPVLPHVDYFMPSMEEALFLSDKTTPEEAADFFFELGVGACIFKWGAKGSYIRTKQPMAEVVDGNLPDWCPKDFHETHRLPAFQVTVKDTTGCGDAYCGGFVAGLTQGLSVLESCRLGTATSGLVATGLGSDAGVIDLASTLKFINEAKILQDAE